MDNPSSRAHLHFQAFRLSDTKSEGCFVGGGGLFLRGTHNGSSPGVVTML